MPSTGADKGEETVLLGAGAAPAPWYHPSTKSSYAMKLGLSVTAFMFCSGGMMLVNKQVTMRFGTPLTIVGIQMTFTVAVLGSCFFSTLHFGSRRDAIRWARTISPLYALMLGTSMIALQFSSVGTMTVARNVAPLISLPIEAAFQEKIETTMWTWFSLLYILVGVLIYLSVDVGVGTSTVGLGFVLLNMIAAVVERLMQRRLIVLEPVDLSKTAMLLLNNAFAVLPVAIAVPFAPTSLHGKPEYTEYDAWSRLLFVDYLLLVLSCIIGVAIGWTALNAQSYLTATSMLVVTNMNKVRHRLLLAAGAGRPLRPQLRACPPALLTPSPGRRQVVVVAISIIFMGEAKSWLAILGLTIAISGGAWYGLVQRGIASSKRKTVQAAEAAPADNGCDRTSVSASEGSK
jgi:drug/metabolite transporter (DMT)-like permease